MTLQQLLPAKALTLGYLAGFLLCAGLLGGAYYYEYVEYLEPCPLCIVQRIAALLIGIGCLGAFFARNTRWPLRIALLFTLASALFGAQIANHHVTIQGLPPEQIPECGPGLEYMIQTLPTSELITTLLRGDGSCAEITWRLLGLTMPQWTLIAFIGFALVTILGLIRIWKRGA